MTRNVLDQRLDRTGALVVNILAELSRATLADASDGTDWYPQALAVAAELTPTAPEAGAGIIAALSPQCSWGENVKRARHTLAQGTADGVTFGNATRKADAILAGADPLDVLGGPKVRAFYACILGSDTAVCVDRHALAVARGYVAKDTRRDAKTLELVGAYDRIADAYRHAGHLVGALPSAVQAVTWTSWRRRKGLDWAD